MVKKSKKIISAVFFMIVFAVCFCVFNASAANDGYTGCAFWFDNAPYTGKYMDKVMTISDLEKKTGVDFFVNLPAQTDDAKATAVETTVDPWWK